MHLWKEYKSKKQLVKENEELKIALEKAQETAFEEYFLKNSSITTVDGLGLEFRGKELVKIFASSFWNLVKDCDNYVVMDLSNRDGESVEVTIKKKGRLSPQDKLKKVEVILNDLLQECAFKNEAAIRAEEYLNGEVELKKKYLG